MPIRVLVVDDSPLVREVLTELLAVDTEIAVVGAARDPYEAREMIRERAPDVITLDVEMPNMNGVAFLERLMRLKPLPVVMVSTLTQKGADVTLLALELGAVDFVAKPLDAGPNVWAALGAELRGKVRAAAGATPVPRRASRGAPQGASAPMRCHPRALVAVGASTGGVEALRTILVALPPTTPPIVVVQHMPAGFTARFAQRLDDAAALRVREAADGMPLAPGEVAVAPGDRHLTVVAEAGRYLCRITPGEPVSGHRPSVDVLFRSVAAAAGPHAVGVILTGMGKDGAEGLLAMRQAGARTLGQDAATSLVYGMPRAAVAIGAVAIEAALEDLPARILVELAAAAHAAA
jgi:two-component system chemotaxis response regulator CheB